MTLTTRDRLRRLLASKAYLMFVTAHLTTLGIGAYGMFHAILPYYLRRILNNDLDLQIDDTTFHNSTSKTAQNDTFSGEISRSIGVITGTGAGFQLMMSFFAGFILKRCSLRFNLILGSLFNIASVIVVYFSQSVIMLCAANALVSAGQLWQFTTTYAYLCEFARDSNEVTFLVAWSNMFNSAGFVFGYSAVSAANQFFGSGPTFGTLAGLLFFDLFLRWSLPKLEADVKADQKHNDEVLASNDNNELENGARPTSWWSYLRNWNVILLAFVTVMHFIITSTMWATAPNRLANDLGGEQWQTGLIMGLGQGAGLIGNFFNSVIVKSHKRRMILIILTQLVKAGSCIGYPFVDSVWTAACPDIAFRACRDAGITLIITLFPYVVLCKGIGDTRMANSLFGVCVSIGMLIGYYGSGFFVVLITFKWLYIIMAILEAALISTFIPYIGLQPQSDDVPTIGVTKVNHSTLNIADISSIQGSAMNLSWARAISKNSLSGSKLHMSTTSVFGSNLHVSANSIFGSKLQVGRAHLPDDPVLLNKDDESRAEA